MKQKKEYMIIGGVIEGGATALVNKTGTWRSMRPVWDSKRCINCLICPVYCPDRAIHMKSGERLKTDLDYCKGCGICAQVCPTKCISMIAEEEADD